MAPAPRSKTTGTSRTRKTTGAAPAVVKDTTQTVESDEPLVVDPTTDQTPMERAEAEADAEDARQQTAAKAEHAAAEAAETAEHTNVASTNVASTVPDDEPAKITEGLYGPAGTKEEPVVARDLVDPVPGTQKAPNEVSEAAVEAFAHADEPKAPTRDLNVLKALADTSGRDPVTPYSEGTTPAPAAVQSLPVLRDTYDWTREGDVGAVGRVIIDGFRVKCNGHYRFARKGDRVYAPDDVIALAVKRGVMVQEG